MKFAITVSLNMYIAKDALKLKSNLKQQPKKCDSYEVGLNLSYDIKFLVYLSYFTM